jgi:hypothetical protein
MAEMSHGNRLSHNFKISMQIFIMFKHPLFGLVNCMSNHWVHVLFKVDWLIDPFMCIYWKKKYRICIEHQKHNSPTAK